MTDKTETTERVCQCSLRTKLVGDGCDVCNPEYAAQFAEPGYELTPEGRAIAAAYKKRQEGV